MRASLRTCPKFASEIAGNIRFSTHEQRIRVAARLLFYQKPKLKPFALPLPLTVRLPPWKQWEQHTTPIMTVVINISIFTIIWLTCAFAQDIIRINFSVARDQTNSPEGVKAHHTVHRNRIV